MIDAARDVMQFATGRTRSDIEGDRQFQLSVLHSMQIVGEAASNLPESIRIRHHEIPWAKIIGMRHHIVHGYPSVNYGIIWETVTTELEPLIERLERVLDDLG